MTSSQALYRGVCVENDDPAGMGRIRVRVPQVLSGVTGWATPAWTVEDREVHPDDCVPDVGQGVWVLFEGPDAISWIATYGEREQPVPDEDALYVPVVEWDLSVLPEGVERRVSGTVVSRAGVPYPSPEVTVWRTRVEDDPGPGVRIRKVAVDPGTGAFEFRYARPAGEEDCFYRAEFQGTYPFVAEGGGPVGTGWTALSDTATAILWSEPTHASVPWLRAATVSGSLLNARSVGLPDCEVVLEQSVAPYAEWTAVGRAETGAGGNWSIDFQRTEIAPIALRASFPGDDSHDPSSTDPAMLAKVSVRTSLEMAPVPPPASDGAQVAVSGVLDSGGYPPVPQQVSVQTRRRSGDGWTTAVRIGVGAAGAWSGSIAFAGARLQVRAAFQGSEPFTSSESAVQVLESPSESRIVPDPLPSLSLGQPFHVTGTVLDAAGHAAQGGTVSLEQRDGGSNSWAVAASSPVAVDGSWRISHTAPAVPGTANYRLSYSGDGPNLPKVTAEHQAQVVLEGTRITGSQTTTTYTSAGFSWGQVPGPTASIRYEVQWGTSANGPWTVIESALAAVSKVHTGRAEDSTNCYRVRAWMDVDGQRMYGPWSPVATCRMGHTELRNSSNGSINIAENATCVASWTWRALDGWKYTGNGDQVVQGYYTDSRANAYGILQYHGAAWRQSLIARAGGDPAVCDNVVFDRTFVHMARAGGGSQAGDPPVQIRWWVTGAVPAPGTTGSAPAMAGGSDFGPQFYLSEKHWCEIPAHWGAHVLLNQNLGGSIGVINSIGIYWAGKERYARFLGASSGQGYMHPYVSWNYVTRSAKASSWS